MIWKVLVDIQTICFRTTVSAAIAEISTVLWERFILNSGLFLKQFAADAEAPVDFLPVEPTLCVVSYAVSGKILKYGQRPIQAGNCSFTIEEMEQLDYELKCPKPYFVFTSQFLELPWILDEDKDEVVSPANEPECLERMWKKLLIDAPDTCYKS